jgi:hypothetical protein
MANPNLTYTDQFISDGKKDSNSIRNFFDTYLVSSNDNPDHIYRAAFNDFYLKHYQDLLKITEAYLVPEQYFYQPKTVSYLLYGTTEMWLGLLRLNDMKNVAEFYRPLIAIYNPSKLKQLISIFFKRGE